LAISACVSSLQASTLLVPVNAGAGEDAAAAGEDAATAGEDAG
jgi:hypothetical protein